VKTRYRRPEVDGVLVSLDDTTAVLEFSEQQEPVAPGQSVVMYDGDMVLCGGIACR